MCVFVCTQGAYLLNVVVHEDHRGQGVGKALMWAAMQRAYNMWNAKSLYTHVEADNEVKEDHALYLPCDCIPTACTCQDVQCPVSGEREKGGFPKAGQYLVHARPFVCVCVRVCGLCVCVCRLRIIYTRDVGLTSIRQSLDTTEQPRLVSTRHIHAHTQTQRLAKHPAQRR